MSSLIFGSLYGASVWDVQLVDKDKKNTHSCGAYTANNLDKASRMAMRNESRDLYRPILKAIISDCIKLKSTVESHQVLLDVLIKETCLEVDQLINLATHSSANKGEVWPYSYEATMPDKPATILFSQTFQIFDHQCVIVDSLIRTQWLPPSHGKQLHKKLVHLIRNFMQTTAETINVAKNSKILT